MSPILIAALPFLGALLPGLMVRAGRDVAAMAVGSATLLALLGLFLHAPTVLAGGTVEAGFSWLPQIGLAADFRIDGLGFLFATLILGIGLLIILYARYYLSSNDSAGAFYSYLMLFQGAMVGIVLSDNILLLLIFWELTSLSSFLLIGFWKHLPEGRQGARMALTVTGMGGLAMIGGMLILGQIAGSFQISEILQHKEAIQASPLYLPALILILIGAFTKSAQFPFHFWLPHAMAAPTPVSAYLHSATMVKAGLFLMARLWPVLSGTPEWFWIVSSVGLITMVIGAKIAFFKDDLKAILAFSTVSHLGLITMLLGVGTESAAIAAVFHIINHATFKAALFMGAGIVDHETGTRSVKRLGGLRRLMPLTFVLFTIAGLSMAGIPPLNGFLSKEMMLEVAAHTHWLPPVWLFGALATLGALFSVAYSFRLIVHTFLGEQRIDYPKPPHDPGPGLWLSPAILVVLVIAIGLAPQTIAGPLVEAASSAVTGHHTHPHLKLWHGVTPALWMSVIAVAGGLALLLTHRGLQGIWDGAPRPEAKTLFEGLTNRLSAAALALTDGMQNGSLTRYLAVFTVAATGLGLAGAAGGHLGPETRALTPVSLPPLVVWVLLMVATASVVMLHRYRLLALVLLGIIGLIVSVSFVYLSAPDLALTQISVEVVTVMLLLLALNFLPKITRIESPPIKRLGDTIIAVAAGLAVGGLSYALMRRDFLFETISDFHLAQSYLGGGGTNVVNVILVDFRGYDTFGEITVLGIAALTIYALAEALLDGPASRILANWRHDTKRAGDRHPMMMVVVTRMMMPVTVMVGAFIFLRGHNEPGGGFIAGLVVAIALLMQYMASGFAWAQARQRVLYHGMIGAGVVIAALTGLGAWLAGRPFLTSAYGYLHPPLFEKFEWATAALFDLGVFLTVVGAVMLSLASLSRIARRAGETVNLEPMDIDPSATPAKGDA